MDGQYRRTFAVPLVVVLSIALTGCGPGASSSATPSQSASPGPASPSPAPSDAAYNLTVVPASFTGKVFSGSKVVLLVSVDGAASDGPVSIYSSGNATVEPAEILPGAVSEVTVIAPACPTGCGDTGYEVQVRGVRGSVRRSETRVMTISPETSQLEPEARMHLEPFVTWLAVHQPELGITASTAWEGVPGSWVLVVEHYLFFSPEWELDLSWHVMIAPDDWSTIALRRRGSELAPSFAFKIDSVSGNTAPHQIDPPESVWR